MAQTSSKTLIFAKNDWKSTFPGSFLGIACPNKHTPTNAAQALAMRTFLLHCQCGHQPPQTTPNTITHRPHKRNQTPHAQNIPGAPASPTSRAEPLSTYLCPTLAGKLCGHFFLSGTERIVTHKRQGHRISEGFWRKLNKKNSLNLIIMSLIRNTQTSIRDQKCPDTCVDRVHSYYARI